MGRDGELQRHTGASANLAETPRLQRQERSGDWFRRDCGDRGSGRDGGCRAHHGVATLPYPFPRGAHVIEIAETLRELQVDEKWIHEISRRKMLHDPTAFTKRTFEEPEKAREELLTGVRSYLGPDYDIETHFPPKYRPWRQRLAFVPDGALFTGIAAGKASVATDEIEHFTEKGVLLKSGKMLEADIVVTATGFDLCPLGDIDFVIDGAPVAFHDTVTYRGTMFTGVPNMVWVFGYFRASWTPRADLVADFVCKMLKHIRTKNARQVTVALRPEDKDMPLLDWIDTDNFNPGYMMRGMHLLPRRGDKREWMHNQDYWDEKDEIPATNLDDAAFVYRYASAGVMRGA
jgi:cation diffusion facilitator CzcD-associated flavoprotein CzcO